MPSVVTIREAVQRAKADGLPISEYTLRMWVRSGAIPTRKAGQKALIYYPNLISYLRCDGISAGVSATTGTTGAVCADL